MTFLIEERSDLDYSMKQARILLHALNKVGREAQCREDSFPRARLLGEHSGTQHHKSG